MKVTKPKPGRRLVPEYIKSLLKMQAENESTTIEVNIYMYVYSFNRNIITRCKKVAKEEKHSMINPSEQSQQDDDDDKLT